MKAKLTMKGKSNELNKPIVSVITPAFNAEHTIRGCVESIRMQSFKDWEHIVIDDGSTDGTWELLTKFALEDSRFRTARQVNAGQGKARNVGISIARASYIALLDADDRSVPERLEMQVNFMNNNPDVDVLGGAIINVDNNGNELGFSGLAANHDTLVSEIYRRCPFYTSTVMAKSFFFHALGGFDQSLHRAQDRDLWLRGYRQFCFHNLQVPLTYYRRSTTPSWRDAIYSAHVIMRAIQRDGKSTTYYWYVLRPLLATALVQLKLRRLRYSS